MKNGFRAVSEYNLDQLETFDREHLLKLFHESNQMYQCPHCNRIILENKKDSESGWDFFLKET